MDIFSEAICNFSNIPHLTAWKEARAIFENAASKRPKHWLLPFHACESVGGSQEQAVPVVTAVGCAHISILLVDDMLDDDPRGDYHRVGMPASANLASVFQAAALHLISQCIKEQIPKVAALNSINEMFLSTTFGQSLDVLTFLDEATYWKVAQTKSSPFFGMALQTGALAGGGTIGISEQLNEVGHLYGEMIQIHDDMHDSMEVPANPDWVQGRAPLPILFASLVNHPQQNRFIKLSQNIRKANALQEAQEILIQCGAISYCADQIIQKYRMAKKLLNNIQLVNPSPVSLLLDEIVDPVSRLLEATQTYHTHCLGFGNVGDSGEINPS